MGGGGGGRLCRGHRGGDRTSRSCINLQVRADLVCIICTYGNLISQRYCGLSEADDGLFRNNDASLKVPRRFYCHSRDLENIIVMCTNIHLSR